MNRLTVILGITLMVTLLAFPVFARGHGSGGGHQMMGHCDSGSGDRGQRDRESGDRGQRDREYGDRGQRDRGYGDLSREQRGKLDQLERKFYNETSELRNKIWAKSEELDSFLNSADPDFAKARALQKEISDLRAKLDEKRLNYKLEVRKNNPDA